MTMAIIQRFFLAEPVHTTPTKTPIIP